MKGTAMKKDYQIISKKDSRELANFLAKEGQLLLPMLDLLIFEKLNETGLTVR